MQFEDKKNTKQINSEVTKIKLKKTTPMAFKLKKCPP